MCTRELQDALSETDRSFFNSGTMAEMWCATECRFKALDTAAKLSQVFRTSRVQNLVDLQQAIKHLKATPDAENVLLTGAWARC